MAQFPKSINTRSFEWMRSSSKIFINFPLGEKVYALLDGKLRAVIPMGQVVHNTGTYQAGINFYGYIAGESEMTIIYTNTFFKTIEHYQRFVSGEDTPINMGLSISLFDAIRGMGFRVKEDITYFHIKGYSISRSYDTPYSDSVMPIQQMWHDAEGLHINFLEDGVHFIKKEDAIKAQLALVDIVDFDNKPAPTKEYALDINISVCASSLEEAKKEALKQLATTGLKIIGE